MSIELSDAVINDAIAVSARAAHPVFVLPVVDRAEWDSLVARLPFTHLPQSFAYGQGKAAKGWTVTRIAFEQAGRTIAVATVLERRILGIRILARVNRGPMFCDAAPSFETQRDVHRALRRAFRGPLMIAPALVHSAQSHAALRAAGFHLRHDNGWRSGRIDLSPSEDQLWSGFASTFRNRARQAAKQGAELRIAGDEASFEWMLARHAENMAAKQFSAADATLLRAMRAASPDDVLVFQLMHEGAPVAGMSVSRFGAVAEYHIGWFGPEGRRLNAGNFLMWEIIKDMKRRGVRQFDVGGLKLGDGYTRFKQTMKPEEFRLAGEWLCL